MKLTDIGVVHKCNEATIRINDAISPIKRSIVITALDRIQPMDADADKFQNHTINNARSAFVIIESYWIEVLEWHKANSIRRYWEARNGNTIDERWELFGHLVDSDDWNFVFDAHSATRPTEAMETENEPSKKKQSSPS